MKMNTGYHIIDCDDEEYNLLFHKPTAKLARINKNIHIDHLNIEELDRKVNQYRKPVEITELVLGNGQVSMTYMSARTCNLGCKYCFAGKGEYGEKDGKPKQLSYELYMDALNIALKMYPEGIKRIGFFGGEPLLNFNEIKRFIPDCIQVFEQKELKRPQFTITTNLILLTEEMAELFSEYNILVSVSLDGSKEINDAARMFKTGNKSVYEAVLRNCTLLDKYEIGYVLQATLNRNHIENYTPGEAVLWIKTLEILNYKNISIIPVETKIDSLSLDSPDYLYKLDLFTRELTNYYLDKIYSGDLSKIATLLVRPMIQIARNEYLRSCTSGHSFIWDTDGSAYSCHMFCNHEIYKLGDVENGFQADMVKNMANINRNHGHECKSCIAGKICTVWCKGIQFLSGNDVYQVCNPRCIFQKAIMEECIKRLSKIKKDVDMYQIYWSNYKKFNERLLGEGYEDKVMV